MPRWALQCDNCNFVFTHSTIADAGALDFFLPEKPEFPGGGSALECPNCGHKDTYQRHELVYRT
jgi:rubredoxin